jgi:hypothetical protein
MLNIKKIETSNKNKIKQCKLAEMGVLMKHPFRCYIVGASGSGKTNLMLNLLTRVGFYKNWFDRIFCLSPTALSLDESYKALEKNTKYKQGKDLLYLPCKVEALQAILDVQEQEEKAKKVLVILDDIVSFGRFCRSNELLTFFVMGRHYNLSIFLLSQAFHLIPKSIRLNMSCIIYFKGSMVETESLIEQYCPAGYSKKDFQKKVELATDAPYSFLYINLNTPMHSKIPRYRKNLTDDLLGGREVKSVRKNK